MNEKTPTPLRHMVVILGTWWPLALSWLLMGVELPVISAVVARLPDQEVQLAAFGGVVFPISLMVEAPVIMLLAASTALSTNTTAFTVLKRFMMKLAFIMTMFHIIIAFTPLYDLAVVPLLDIPEAVREPARRGLMIMTPWTWAIADRRTNQGMLIRFGYRSAVAIGTGVRLVTTVSVLLVGWLLFEAEGVVVASSSLTIGTISEAVYARHRARPVISGVLKDGPFDEKVVRGVDLLKFYIPLAMTPLLVLTMQPIGTAGIDRMPNAVISLAVWAPVGGMVFLCRSAGVAYNEVVIGHCGNREEIPALRLFAWVVGSIFTIILAVVALTPLSGFWFSRVMGLDPELVELGMASLWIAIPIPLLTFLQSLYQGVLVDSHRTRFITESVALFLVVTSLVIWAGVLIGPENGVIAVLLAYTIGNLIQTGWLWHRCRTAIFRVMG
ncbi:MAG: hypothetical protein P8J45_08910 [Phycisphaerales bacterium]|nr:hypothetical protein [Phycisphaerales bacterium]